MFEEELSTLSTADLLESAAGERTAEYRSAARSLVHAVVYADRFHPDVCPGRPGRRVSDGRERAVVLGGDGCPPVMEFCVAEYGAVLGVSPGVARDYLANALALRHRFPFVWVRVLEEKVTAWKARNLARDCEKLSLEAALYVDRKVAQLLDTISPTRLAKIIKAAKMYADPDLAKAETDETTAERGVWVGQSDEHGTKTCVIKASSAAVRRHKAKIDEIADALLAQGDKRSIQARRAEAVGIMPDFAFADELIAQAREYQRTNPTAPQDSAPTSGSSAAPAPSPTQTPTAGPPSATTESALGAAEPESPPATGSALSPATGLRLVRSAGSETAADDRPQSKPRDTWGSSRDCVMEPGPDDEADRDAPRPETCDLADPLDAPHLVPEPFHTGRRTDPSSGEDGEAMTAAERRALDARLAQIRQDAYARPPGQRPGSPRPGKTELYVHLTDDTLIAAARGANGVVRAEGIGPLLATQLTELIGHGPYLVKPVIDLNDAISEDAYEASDRLREYIKLIHPAELFPFGTRETTNSTDLDHIEPYDPLGPPGQTNTANLAPLSRYGHRVKTRAQGWKFRRIDATAVEWTTPHGFVFRVDGTGTHRIFKEAPDG